MATTWIGIALITGGFVVVLREPIQVDKFYWTAILNGISGLIACVLGAIFIGLNLRKLLDNEPQEEKETT